MLREDYLSAIAVDVQGVIYATGSTGCEEGYPAFPTTPGAYDPGPQVAGAFVVSLDPAGNGAADLLYSTFLGETRARREIIALDSTGAIYVTGATYD